MKELKTKHDIVKIFARTIENEALEQIEAMANSPIGENAHIRIMPDCHAGKGCVIGTTMKIKDKVCPNLVGVDIGCGVLLRKTNIDFASRLEELDNVIREYIPNGLNVHKTVKPYDFAKLRCWDKLRKETRTLAEYSQGTLGGGNHFIEAYEDGYIAVHSGSRNIGYKVAEYYQDLAERHIRTQISERREQCIKVVPPKEREKWLQNNVFQIDKGLTYLEGDDLEDYLHDIGILQKFAYENRSAMLNEIVERMGGIADQSEIDSVHNYIDVENRILRKGAISATYDEVLVIPLNMKDGLLICRGKGNEDWNYSAPHGAGRLYSRAVAKRTFTVEEFKEVMKGIYTTCISGKTLDEAPFAYKDYAEIMECIEPTVSIENRIVPIFNFKAN